MYIIYNNILLDVCKSFNLPFGIIIYISNDWYNDYIKMDRWFHCLRMFFSQNPKFIREMTKL
jgi:hypothetical protein